MKSLVFAIVWLLCGAGLVLAYFKFVSRLWAPGILLLVISAGLILMNVGFLYFLKRYETPIVIDPVAARTGLMVMRPAENLTVEPMTWAVCFIIASLALVQYPDLLWRWWLAYPAALLLTLLIPILFLVVTAQRFTRILADSNGIEERIEARVLSMSDKKVAWRDVGAVKLIDVYIKATGTTSSRNRTDRFLRKELVLQDRSGKELMTLEAPLSPPEDFHRFLEAIPGWTGLAVKEERLSK